MDPGDTVHIEVVCATRDRQLVVSLEVPAGTNVAEAVRVSRILEKFPDLDRNKLTLGVFGRVVDPDTTVVDGDRIEIYRPLIADPKEIRRQLAAVGKTMGRGKDQ